MSDPPIGLGGVYLYLSRSEFSVISLSFDWSTLVPAPEILRLICVFRDGELNMWSGDDFS